MNLFSPDFSEKVSFYVFTVAMWCFELNNVSRNTSLYTHLNRNKWGRVGVRVVTPGATYVVNE